MDAFEFPHAGEKPQIDDNVTINDLPAMKGAHRKKSSDLGTKVKRWLDRQTQMGLNTGGDPMAEKYITDHKVGPRGNALVHQVVGVPPHAPDPVPPGPKAAPSKAINPITRRGSWGEWEPPTKQAAFFTRKVPDWRYDDHLAGYVSKEGKAFTCACGEKIPAPSYTNCKCGSVWNVFAVGDAHHLASNTADFYIAREVPVRPGVIMASKKAAQKSHRGLLAEIDKLADWTKYDGPDPINAMGKTKIPSTSVPTPPQDWAKRTPAGDPSKKGGTWTPPPIAPKKK